MAAKVAMLMWPKFAPFGKMTLIFAITISVFIFAYWKYESYQSGTNFENSGVSAANIRNPWTKIPQFELLIIMTSNFVNHFRDVLIPSMNLFLSKNVTILVILNNKSTSNHRLTSYIEKSWNNCKVFFEDPKPSAYLIGDHIRMQWSMFHPDKYTKAQYIGYLDTDTQFVTMVTPWDLFDGGKPRIVAEYGGGDGSWWELSSQLTARLFQDPFAIMKCMSNFPILVRTQHIINLRRYLENKYKKTFDQIFQEFLGKKHLCPFCIMCQYIYKFHRNEYTFHMQMVPNEGRTNTAVGPDRGPIDLYMKRFGINERKPFARVAIHWKYHMPNEPSKLKIGRNIFTNANLLLGVCHSGGFNSCPKQCSFFNRTRLHYQMFMFDGFWTDYWTWDKNCKESEITHYQQVQELSLYYKENGINLFGNETIVETCGRLERNLKDSLRTFKRKKAAYYKPILPCSHHDLNSYIVSLKANLPKSILAILRKLIKTVFHHYLPIDLPLRNL